MRFIHQKKLRRKHLIGYLHQDSGKVLYRPVPGFFSLDHLRDDKKSLYESANSFIQNLKYAILLIGQTTCHGSFIDETTIHLGILSLLR